MSAAEGVWDEVRNWIDEQQAFDAFKMAVENAVNRELTETEVRYIKWISRYDNETIETFISLFEDAAIQKK